MWGFGFAAAQGSEPVTEHGGGAAAAAPVPPVPIPAAMQVGILSVMSEPPSFLWNHPRKSFTPHQPALAPYDDWESRWTGKVCEDHN